MAGFSATGGAVLAAAMTDVPRKGAKGELSERGSGVAEVMAAAGAVAFVAAIICCSICRACASRSSAFAGWESGDEFEAGCAHSGDALAMAARKRVRSKNAHGIGRLNGLIGGFIRF